MVLSYYYLSFNPEEYTDEIKKNLSIIVTFWHTQLKPKINKQFPSKTCKVKFKYHEALVMIDAFLKFQRETFGLEEHNLNNAIIEIFKIQLHKQIV